MVTKRMLHRGFGLVSLVELLLVERSASGQHEVAGGLRVTGEVLLFQSGMRGACRRLARAMELVEPLILTKVFVEGTVVVSVTLALAALKLVL